MSDAARVQALAEEVMALSRNAIVMHLRFMDMAVFRLHAEPADVNLATDGRRLWYGPEYVLKRYIREEAQLRRDYLHVLLHCVFRHPFIDSLVDRDCWDLAADIAVEALILGLEEPGFSVAREAEQRRIIEALERRLGLLTAEKLYRHFRDDPPPSDWAPLFFSDQHDLWHKPRRSRAPRAGEPDDADDPDRPDGDARSRSPQEDGANREKAAPSGDGEAPKREAEGETLTQPSAPEAPAAGDEVRRAHTASAPEESGDDAPSQRQMMQSEAGGESGDTLYRKDDRGDPQNRNTGRGMDTEGREDGAPAGAQSRNDKTQAGVDSPTANGVSGDSADAQSQSAESQSGGSGSGLNDAHVAEPGERGDDARDAWLDERLREDRDRLKREWQDVGERMRLDLESRSRQRGALPGSLMRQLELGGREPHDYAAFLRKFAVLGEHMQINDDEFDAIFYTYGLKLYGNLPLIEPLETKEVKRIREFVIAIDTSGSTSGALVERFLARTYEILSSEESFFRKIHLRILQCDAEIQESAVIQCREDFERYLRAFSAKGLGGTDFRPVFDHVDALLREGAFTQLKGLIYFTDGQGVYPARKPDYETAFVFVEREDTPPPEVPPWAMRLVLNEREITEDNG